MTENQEKIATRDALETAPRRFRAGDRVLGLVRLYSSFQNTDRRSDFSIPGAVLEFFCYVDGKKVHSDQVCFVRSNGQYALVCQSDLAPDVGMGDAVDVIESPTKVTRCYLASWQLNQAPYKAVVYEKANPARVSPVEGSSLVYPSRVTPVTPPAPEAKEPSKEIPTTAGPPLCRMPASKRSPTKRLSGCWPLVRTMRRRSTSASHPSKESS